MNWTDSRSVSSPPAQRGSASPFKGPLLVRLPSTTHPLTAWPRLQPFVYLLRVRSPWLTWKPRAASGDPILAWVSVFGVGPASRSLLFFVPRVWGSLLTLNPRSRPTTPSKFRRLRKRRRGACLLVSSPHRSRFQLLERWNVAFRTFSRLKPFTDLTDSSTFSAPHIILLGEVVYSLHVLQPLLGPWRPRRPPRSRRGRVLSPVLGFWRARPTPETPVPPGPFVLKSP